jgi:hypothetical protein
MERRITAIAAAVLYAILFASIGHAQTDNAAESKFLTIGDISNIDLKNKSITISQATSYNIAQLSNGGASGVSAGRSGGGGAVRGGGRGGRRGGGSSVASTGRGASAPIPMEYKVTASSKTLIKEGENALHIEDLRVGDRLQVFSMKGGSKLAATEIIRTPKSTP